MTSYSRMSAVLCCWALVLVAALQSAASPQQLCRVDELREKVVKRIDELWTETADWPAFAKKKSGFDAQLVTEFRKVCEKIDEKDPPNLHIRVLERLEKFALMLEEENNILRIYETFTKLQRRPDPEIFADLWRQLAKTVINDRLNKRSVIKSLAVLYEIIDDDVEGHENIFQLALKNEENLACEVNQSPQQLLFNMYTTFQLTQLKAYTMVHFSWMLLQLYDQGNYTLEAKYMKDVYLKRMESQAAAITIVMKHCKNDLWSCEPASHVEGETFVKITKFLQGYIVNEVDLNTDNSCSENCAFYQHAKQTSCFKEQFCASQPTCNGKVVGCKFVDSDMWICQSPHLNDRRYEWIEYENGRTMGQRNTCKRAVKKVDSWWRYLFWHCSYCYCFCDDPRDPRSDRYFSLRAATADTLNNKVVTGLRFVKLNRVVHLQIQQGELLSHGEVNKTTVEWVPVEEFDVRAEGVEAGKDYHMLTWENRAIDLDDIKLPEGQLLTGLKLRKIGGHLNLEIQGNEFDYETGKLTHYGRKAQWYGNDNTDGAFHQPRSAHTLRNPDVPDRNNGLNTIDSQPDTYIEFTATDTEFDAGQTAVPFINIQSVIASPTIALVGAGIVHKGRQFSGGYIALKAFTYSQGKHIKNVFPDINESEF